MKYETITSRSEQELWVQINRMADRGYKLFSLSEKYNPPSEPDARGISYGGDTTFKAIMEKL